MNQQAFIRYASVSQAMINLAGKDIGTRILIGDDTRWIVVPSSAGGGALALWALQKDDPWPSLADVRFLFPA